jgi:hypothetical protein
VAQSSFLVLSRTAKEADYTSALADYRCAAAKNHDYCHGIRAYRGSSAAEVRRNGRHSRRSDDCCSCWASRHVDQSLLENPADQPTRDGPCGTCALIARAGSTGGSIPRILRVRGHDLSNCLALPRYAGYSRNAETDCCPSLSLACAASSLSLREADFVRAHAGGEKSQLCEEKHPGGHSSLACRVSVHPERRGVHQLRRRLPDD